MVRVGVFGANPKGERHIQQLTGISGFDLTGIYDPDIAAAKKISDRFTIPYFSTPDGLINSSDAIDFELPANTYFDLLTRIITRSKHVFLDYPVSLSLERITQLNELSREADVIIQVNGHERLNPAFQTIIPHIRKPMFMEIRRRRRFLPDLREIDVLKQMLVPDIDMAIYFSRSNVQRITATGIHIVDTPVDLINARLEFDNGCVADISWSNFTGSQGGYYKVFQKGKWFNLNLEDQKITMFQTGETGELPLREEELPRSPKIESIELDPAPEEPGKDLLIFQEAILHKNSPLVDIDEAFFSVKTLYELLEIISRKT
jgi:predicted dehydrogenase